MLKANNKSLSLTGISYWRLIFHIYQNRYCFSPETYSNGYSFLFTFPGTVHSFLGNQTHQDHFKLLQSDGENLLIGARNVVYNISLKDLQENRDQVL